MKRIANKLAIAITSLAIIFTSCSNSVDGTIGNIGLLESLAKKEIVYSNDGTYKQLTVFATSDGGVIDFSEGSRTITPDGYKASDLDFYLSGTDIASGNALYSGSAIKVDFTSSNGTLETEGSVPVDLPVSDYKLTLVAVESGTPLTPGVAVTGYETVVASEALENAVLKADSNADLRYNQMVKFYLSPRNLSGDSGQIKLTLKTFDYADENADAKTLWSDHRFWVHISLQDVKDGKIIESAGSIISDTTNALLVTKYTAYKGSVFVSNPTATDTSSSSFTNPTGSITSWGKLETEDGLVYTLPKVPSGTYNLVVDFTDGKKHYYYSDDLLALTNQPIDEVIEIPNVIEKAPKAPSNLQVGYNDLANPTAGYYLATFQWQDNSNNEEYFVLQLMDVSKHTDNVTVSGTTFGLHANAITLLDEVAGAPDNAGKSTDLGFGTVVDAWNAEIPHAAGISLDKTVYQNTSSLYAAGSLDKNSTSVSLWLPLGSVYVARICAYNDACTSLGDTVEAQLASDQEWYYSNTKALTSTGVEIDKLPSVFTAVTTNGVVAGTYSPNKWPKAEAFVVATSTEANTAPMGINRYRITYNLNSGSFWEVKECGKLNSVYAGENKDGGSETIASFADPDVNLTNKIKGIDSKNNYIVEYHTITKAGTTIIDPLIYKFQTNEVTPADKIATLFDNSDAHKVWSSWRLENINGVEVDTDNYEFRTVDWDSGIVTDTEHELNVTKVNASDVVYDINNTKFDAQYVEGSGDPLKTYYVLSKYGYVKTTGYVGSNYYREIQKDNGAYTLAKTLAASVDGNTGVRIRSSLANYMSYGNLDLFANYINPMADVYIYSPDNYDLKPGNIRVLKKHGTDAAVAATNKPKNDGTQAVEAGTYTDFELDVPEFAVSLYYDKLIFKVVETALASENKDCYRKVHFAIAGKSGKDVVVDGTNFTVENTTAGSGSGGKDPLAVGAHHQYVYEVNTAMLRPGKYNMTISGYADVNEKEPFTYQISFEVRDPKYTAYAACTDDTHDGVLFELDGGGNYYKSEYSTFAAADADGVTVYYGSAVDF